MKQQYGLALAISPFWLGSLVIRLSNVENLVHELHRHKPQRIRLGVVEIPRNPRIAPDKFKKSGHLWPSMAIYGHLDPYHFIPWPLMGQIFSTPKVPCVPPFFLIFPSFVHHLFIIFHHFSTIFHHFSPFFPGFGTVLWGHQPGARLAVQGLGPSLRVAGGPESGAQGRQAGEGDGGVLMGGNQGKSTTILGKREREREK